MSARERREIYSINSVKRKSYSHPRPFHSIASLSTFDFAMEFPAHSANNLVSLYLPRARLSSAKIYDFKRSNLFHFTNSQFYYVIRVSDRTDFSVHFEEILSRRCF